jgi:hypothetical protein
MKKSTTVLQHVLGSDDDNYPLMAERIAIDVTNALRGAEMGLRGFRNRPLLRRLWHGVTGQGQELEAAIGHDLVTVQKATLSLIREIMEEESRTQYCVNKVLNNLHAVNRDVDDLLQRTSVLESDLNRRLERLRIELYEEMRSVSQLLAAEIASMQRRIDREATVRRLTERYRAGALTKETGELLGASLYVATIASYRFSI